MKLWKQLLLNVVFLHTRMKQYVLARIIITIKEYALTVASRPELFRVTDYRNDYEGITSTRAQETHSLATCIIVHS